MSEQNLVDVAQQSFADDFDGGYNDGGDFEGGDAGGEGAPGPGQGQSKSSRRRRRKRKGKVAGSPDSGSDNAGSSSDGPAPVTIVMEGESLSLAASAAPQQARRPQQQQNGGGQQQPGQGQGKRWKKKFRDRERRPGGGGRSENPGNDFRAEAQPSSNGGGYGRPDNFGNSNGGFKRKNKGGGGGQGQGGQRGFVGPMDHSYREIGANDGPPSTVMLGRGRGQRHHGDNQPIDHNAPRPVPIPENAQTHIYFFIDELFFVAKIQETARKQGVKIAFVKNDKEALDQLTSGEDTDKPALIVFDLNNVNAKPLTTIPKLKAKLKRGTSIVGFLSHLQGDLKAKAMEAGCDVVMPRAAFSQNLPNLLRRYGVEEEDEVNYNY